MASSEPHSQLSQATTLHAESSLTESLLQPFRRPAGYAKRAAISAAYPLRGIWYFLRHREFYPLFVGRLLPLSIISFLVYFILFTFAFLPQFAFLAIFHGWGAWLNAVVLVLGEGLVIIQVGLLPRALGILWCAIPSLSTDLRARDFLRASLSTNVA
jgi:hypothetical protein